MKEKIKKNHSWSDQEILYLTKYYSTKGCIYVANKLGKQRSSVYRKAAKLGLKIVINASPNAYLPNEIIFIKKNYPLKGGYYVAKMLGRSPAAIHRKARELKVERQSLIEWSAEEIEYLKKWYYKKRPEAESKPEPLSGSPNLCRHWCKELYQNIQQLSLY